MSHQLQLEVLLAGVEAEVANNLLITQDKFGVAMDLLQMCGVLDFTVHRPPGKHRQVIFYLENFPDVLL